MNERYSRENNSEPKTKREARKAREYKNKEKYDKMKNLQKETKRENKDLNERIAYLDKRVEKDEDEWLKHE